MRLAGIEKGGFYPYPPHMAEATASWFIPLSAGTRGRLLDPCCGEGEIASLLGKLLNCETWGCELFPYRAENAATRMDKCHSAAWESCSLTDESITILWLNAPYDDDRHGEDKRLEFAFLKSTTPKLVRGGVLAFVIPRRILGLTEVARYLAGHYEAITVWRFADGEFERFKQILLLAVRREKYNVPTNEEIEVHPATGGERSSTVGFCPRTSLSTAACPAQGRGRPSDHLSPSGLGARRSGRSHPLGQACARPAPGRTWCIPRTAKSLSPLPCRSRRATWRC